MITPANSQLFGHLLSLAGFERTLFWRTLKIQIITYVSGIAPSRKLGDCNIAQRRILCGNCAARDSREIKCLSVLGVRKNPLIEVTSWRPTVAADAKKFAPHGKLTKCHSHSGEWPEPHLYHS